MRDIMLVFHFIGLAMTVGNAFGHLFLGIAASKFELKESTAFQRKVLYMNYMGKLGLTILILSGGYLMTPYWGMITSIPALFTKLVLVAVITVLVVIASILAKKAKSTEGDQYLEKIRNINFLNVLLGTIVIILAVAVFH